MMLWLLVPCSGSEAMSSWMSQLWHNSWDFFHSSTQRNLVENGFLCHMHMIFNTALTQFSSRTFSSCLRLSTLSIRFFFLHADHSLRVPSKERIDWTIFLVCICTAKKELWSKSKSASSWSSNVTSNIRSVKPGLHCRPFFRVSSDFLRLALWAVI